MATRYGGADRISTKARWSEELEILGRVLSQARENAGLKQSLVAERLGVPASYLSKIEKGTRRLDVVELVRLADAMGIESDALMREFVKALRERVSS